MAKRRSKKKQQQKMIRSFVTLALMMIIGLLSIIIQPWQYFNGGNGAGDKGSVGEKSEIGVTDLQVHYIDVGQADCILIRVPTESGTKNMLVDAGAESSSKDKIVTEYLDSLGIDTLAYMLITHPHQDHASAAKEVIESVKLENLILPECEASQKFWLDMLEAMEAKNLEYIPSKVGDTYQIGDASFEILGPVDMSNDTNPNNYSVVIRLDYGENSFLFTGDAETKYDDDKDHENDEDCSEEEMLKYHPSSKFKCDVFKVGHHGARNATSKAFLAAADPSLAIISVGEGNRYGHPTQEVLDRLAEANVPVLRTDLEGTIIICSDKKEVYRLTK